MHEGHYVFAQVMRHLPLTTFRRCVARYGGEHRIKRFSCLDQYLCLAFAQLTWRESLRDIEACLRAQSFKLYHLGFRSTVARNTLANANDVRDWRIYADFAQHLIGIARRLYADDPLALELDETVYALDSTTIDLCLSLFPWARFRTTKAAVKLHTLLDLRGNIPDVHPHHPTARCTTSTFSINCFPKPAPSTSWIAAISISSVCTPRIMAGGVLRHARQVQPSSSAAAIRVPVDRQPASSAIRRFV